MVCDRNIYIYIYIVDRIISSIKSSASWNAICTQHKISPPSYLVDPSKINANKGPTHTMACSVAIPHSSWPGMLLRLFQKTEGETEPAAVILWGTKLHSGMHSRHVVPPSDFWREQPSRVSLSATGFSDDCYISNKHYDCLLSIET